MTANQVANRQAAESERHNLAYESETARHNVESESIERDRVRVQEEYNRQIVDLENRKVKLQQYKELWNEAHSYATLFGTYPEAKDMIGLHYYDDSNAWNQFWANKALATDFGGDLGKLFDYKIGLTDNELLQAQNWYTSKMDSLSKLSGKVTLAQQDAYARYLKAAADLSIGYQEMANRYEKYSQDISESITRQQNMFAQTLYTYSQAAYQDLVNKYYGANQITNMIFGGVKTFSKAFRDIAIGVQPFLTPEAAAANSAATSAANTFRNVYLPNGKLLFNDND